MNTEYTEAFFNSFQNVMPQLGIESVRLIDIQDIGSQIHTPEVVCIIGIIGDLRGNVIYAMSADAAKKIAGTMMGGMELDEFDEIAQSAVAELGNMLAANACTELSQIKIKVDVSTPTLMVGTFSVSASAERVTRIELAASDFPFDIFLSLEKR
ncbi:chemotaxis protein CheX [Sporobacter termitidis DSM 10068]|uniref:Chemotaxis protein CheX n=1 Tax=Sporobacter termitidis DSM 10068 TaxID=1123282 RepID=A0A1M5Z229_9FIRM|nr:chemotaxis protein CheX [Sporobacter termitidis]SHI18269.1 chemotaxis protein CheX [Sporobacter termitidis DSM 10068]